jgi:hypothetical protein
LTPKAIFIKFSQASILFPIIVGLIYYKRLTSPFRLLFYFFLSGIVFEVQASVLKVIYLNNMPGLHLYTLVEGLVFSRIYYMHFQKNSVLRLFIGINTIVFIGACLADVFFTSTIWGWNAFSRSYSAVSIVCYALIYFYFLFRNGSEQYRTDQPMFWVATGTLFYFSCNMLYFMLHSSLVSNAYIAAFSGAIIHAAINIIAHLLYAQSFRCFKTQKIVVSQPIT